MGAIWEQEETQVSKLLSQHSGRKSVPLNPKADDCNEWKRIQGKEILLIICIFPVTKSAGVIFYLTLRQCLNSVTYFLCFFISLKGT